MTGWPCVPQAPCGVPGVRYQWAHTWCAELLETDSSKRHRPLPVHSGLQSSLYRSCLWKVTAAGPQLLTDLCHNAFFLYFQGKTKCCYAKFLTSGQELPAYISDRPTVCLHCSSAVTFITFHPPEKVSSPSRSGSTNQCDAE